MKKINYLFLLLLSVIILFSSCDEDSLTLENRFENVDYEILAKEDDASILKFLSTHYYNATLDAIKLIENDETSLLNSTNNLKVEEVVNTVDNKEITFKLYTYIIDKGTEENGKPSNIDSLLVNYSGRTLDSENALNSTEFDSNTSTWIERGILGWSYGFTNFSPGEKKYEFGERISFDKPGKGFIFMPSGLAYPSDTYVPQFGVSENPLLDDILVYSIELLAYVKDTDHDEDGIPSILEDPDCNGNPRNDFSDKNTPTIPDFLNPNISKSYSCN